MNTEKKRSSALAPEDAPYSIHSALMHAQNLACNNQFDAAIQECESALSIENPIDPIKDDDIKRVKTELRELIATAKMNKFKKLVEIKSIAQIAKDIEDFEERKNETQAIFVMKRQGFEKVKTLSPSPANFDTITRAKAYWNNVMSLKAKKELLSVRIKDLKVYVDENKSIGQGAKAELSNCVDYAVMSKDFDWKFLMCCCCENTFLDDGKYKGHITSQHCRPFPYKENDDVAPKPVRNSDIEIDDWRPVDVTAAAKLVEEWSRNESGDQNESQDLKLKRWPYCNDINRDNLIKKIQSILEALNQTQCFAPSHLHMLKRLTLEMLKNRIPEMLLKHLLMNSKTLVLVLFLDEPELERVLAFLKEELETSCGLRSLHTSIMRDRLGGDPKIIRKGMVLSDDLSCLIPLFDESKSSGQEYGDHIVQWLFEGDEPIGKKLKEWTKYKGDMKRLGMELHQIVQAEMHRLQNMWEKKFNHWIEGKQWQVMENKCVEQDKSGNSESYRSLFLEQQQEIEKVKSDDEMQKLELKIIRIILEAKADKDIKMLIQKHKQQLLGKVRYQILNGISIFSLVPNLDEIV